MKFDQNGIVGPSFGTKLLKPVETNDKLRKHQRGPNAQGTRRLKTCHWSLVISMVLQNHH